jgi:P-type Mg2+ transporter
VTKNTDELFWQTPIDALYGRVDCTASGLTAAEAATRLARFGPNVVQDIRSPLDEAVVQHCVDRRFEEWTKIDEIPFDFSRRTVSVLAARKDERLLIVK